MSTATCSAARYCFRVIALSNLLFRDTTQSKSTSTITSLLRWNVDVSWSEFSTRSSLPLSNASYCPAWRGDKAEIYFCGFRQNRVAEGRHEEVCGMVGSRDSKSSILGREIEVAASH